MRNIVSIACRLCILLAFLMAGIGAMSGLSGEDVNAVLYLFASLLFGASSLIWRGLELRIEDREDREES